MGYLTTFTIYNDGCDQITKHPKEFAEEIYKACSSFDSKSFGLGYFGGLVNCQKTRHVNDKTIYVHAGNTVCEMNAYSTETQRLMEKSPEFFEEMLKEVEFHVKKLKLKLKEQKLNNKIK